jgi:hypothetical protein
VERRWGPKIKARGIYRDAVRSSGSHFVKTSGLRWISVMLLAPITWAQRVWALPILTALAPSERFYEQRGRQPKTLLERALQLLKLLKHWLPQRDVVAVGDASYAALDFLHGCQRIGITFITRLRLDAALYDPAPPYSGRGRPRKKGDRQPTLQARLDDEATRWQAVDLSWYNGQSRLMEIATVPPGGFIMARQPCPSAGYWCATPPMIMIQLLCYVRMTSVPLRGLWRVSCCAGNWKSPLKRRAAISALNLSANGQTGPLPVLPPCSSVFFRG